MASSSASPLKISQEYGVEALRRDGALHYFLKRADISHRKVGIQTGDDRTHGGHESQGIAARVHHELARQHVGTIRKVDRKAGVEARPRSLLSAITPITSASRLPCPFQRTACLPTGSTFGKIRFARRSLITTRRSGAGSPGSAQTGLSFSSNVLPRISCSPTARK